MQPHDPFSEAVIPLGIKHNVARGWQAKILGWRSQERAVAYPLEGLVRHSHALFGRPDEKPRPTWGG